MKKLYIFLFVAIIAIAMLVVSFLTFNPKVETWTSLFAGFALGLSILSFKPALAYFKRQKSAK